MIDDVDISFHEAFITLFGYDSNCVYIEADGVWFRGDIRSAEVTLHGYDESNDLAPIAPGDGARSLMQTDDGEILTLKFSDTEITLIVEWKDFSARTKETGSYKFTGKSVDIEIRDL